jgi:hypothetical protein
VCARTLPLVQFVTRLETELSTLQRTLEAQQPFAGWEKHALHGLSRRLQAELITLKMSSAKEIAATEDARLRLVEAETMASKASGLAKVLSELERQHKEKVCCNTLKNKLQPKHVAHRCRRPRTCDFLLSVSLRRGRKKRRDSTKNSIGDERRLVHRTCKCQA